MDTFCCIILTYGHSLLYHTDLWTHFVVSYWPMDTFCCIILTYGHILLYHTDLWTHFAVSYWPMDTFCCIILNYGHILLLVSYWPCIDPFWWYQSWTSAERWWVPGVESGAWPPVHRNNKEPINNSLMPTQNIPPARFNNCTMFFLE